MFTPDGLWYPDVMPVGVPQPNGDRVFPGGIVIPFPASCPPDTVPTTLPAPPGCVPAPGGYSPNISYGCGNSWGTAPLGVTPGCEIPSGSPVPSADVSAALPDRGDLTVPTLHDVDYFPWPSPCQVRSAAAAQQNGGACLALGCVVAALGLALVVRGL